MKAIIIISAYIAFVFFNRWLNKMEVKKRNSSTIIPVFWFIPVYWFIWMIFALLTLFEKIDEKAKDSKFVKWFVGKNWKK